MDLKLSMLFLLIAAVLGLPHLSDEKMASIKQQLGSRRWGKLGRHKFVLMLSGRSSTGRRREVLRPHRFRS
jgi:hypothetical protein